MKIGKVRASSAPRGAGRPPSPAPERILLNDHRFNEGSGTVEQRLAVSLGQFNLRGQAVMDEVIQQDRHGRLGRSTTPNTQGEDDDQDRRLHADSNAIQHLAWLQNQPVRQNSPRIARGCGLSRRARIARIRVSDKVRGPLIHVFTTPLGHPHTVGSHRLQCHWLRCQGKCGEMPPRTRRRNGIGGCSALGHPHASHSSESHCLRHLSLQAGRSEMSVPGAGRPALQPLIAGPARLRVGRTSPRSSSCPDLPPHLHRRRRPFPVWSDASRTGACEDLR